MGSSEINEWECGCDEQGIDENGLYCEECDYHQHDDVACTQESWLRND